MSEVQRDRDGGTASAELEEYRRKRDFGRTPEPGGGGDRSRVVVWLEGVKLAGGYALQRIDRRETWLLIKMADEAADPARDPVANRPESVPSGRTIEQLAAHRAGTRSR